MTTHETREAQLVARVAELEAELAKVRGLIPQIVETAHRLGEIEASDWPADEGEEETAEARLDDLLEQSGAEMPEPPSLPPLPAVEGGIRLDAFPSCDRLRNTSLVVTFE